MRAQILNLLLDPRERPGPALVFVSHDIQTVRRMSDRVITMYLGRIVEEAPAGAVTGRSRHPCTRALFSATPGLADPVDPIPLTGPVPSATRPPSGCPFRTRCRRADEVCAGVMPDFAAASAPGRRFRCHHPVQETEGTGDLVAEAAARSVSVSPAAAVAAQERAVRDTQSKEPP
ncbi:hypothetical protein GCM10027075_50000 [Streptomyces heilongjiangensis]